MSYRARQLLLLAIAANAHRPVGGAARIPGFFAGWFAGELTPQVLGISAVDTTISLAKGRAKPFDLAVAALNAALLGRLLAQSRASGKLMEKALADSLGAGYQSGLPAGDPDQRGDLARLRNPFAMVSDEVERIRDVQYADSATGNPKRGRLDIYRAKGLDLADAPVLVQVHGGAWIVGAKEEQGLQLIDAMCRRGWVCVSINYRLAPKHPWPAQIVDVKRAIAWVREHIDAYGGDASHLAITGGSAGGHLAALAALTPNDPAYQPGFEDADTHVDACVPFYGVYDVAAATEHRAAFGIRKFMATRVFGKPFRGHEEEFRAASPFCRIDTAEPSGIPDFLVLHGDLDSLVHVDQARQFVRKLRAVSPHSVTYVELPDTQHAFEVFGSLRSWRVIPLVARWLDWQRLKGSSRQPENPLGNHVA